MKTIMKDTKKIEVKAYDKNTGELIEGIPFWYREKKNPYSKGWIMNSQEALEEIAQDKEITGRIHRVLWLLIANLDFENWIQLSQRDISEKLEMKKQDVSSAIKILEKKRIILRGPKSGRSYSFRLNPNFAWKGDVKYLDEYRRQKEKERIENLKNKINKKRNKKIEILSKKYNIPIEEINYVLEDN